MFDSCSFYAQMLRNCKVARILPRIIEFAKNDRNAVLRARYEKHQYCIATDNTWWELEKVFLNCRCCEYAILMLEYWVDTPEIQRSADLYGDLIKCCIADATSEVFTFCHSFILCSCHFLRGLPVRILTGIPEGRSFFLERAWPRKQEPTTRTQGLDGSVYMWRPSNEL